MPDMLPNTIENYQAAVKSNPNSAEAYCNLGWGQYGQHKFDDSIAAFRQALSLDRNMTDAHYGLGLALKESGGGPEAAAQAVTEFEAVIKLAPQDQNPVRGGMLSRLAQGHINRISHGDWSMDTDLNRASA